MSDVKFDNLQTQGSFIREALADDEVRKSVRARLLAEGRLPHFSREKLASIVRESVAEGPAQAPEGASHKNGSHKNGVSRNGSSKNGALRR